MNFYPWLAIGIGAIFGAWIRWGFGTFLNPIFPTLPIGTLVANLLGGFLIGIMMTLTLEHMLISKEIRLAIITGFLGSLTTFSTFSAEVVFLLTKHEFFWAMLTIIFHVLGSILMTIAGFLLTKIMIGGT